MRCTAAIAVGRGTVATITTYAYTSVVVTGQRRGAAACSVCRIVVVVGGGGGGAGGYSIRCRACRVDRVVWPLTPLKWLLYRDAPYSTGGLGVGCHARFSASVECAVPVAFKFRPRGTCYLLLLLLLSASTSSSAASILLRTVATTDCRLLHWVRLNSGGSFFLTHSYRCGVPASTAGDDIFFLLLFLPSVLSLLFLDHRVVAEIGAVPKAFPPDACFFSLLSTRRRHHRHVVLLLCQHRTEQSPFPKYRERERKLTIGDCCKKEREKERWLDDRAFI